MAMTFDVNVLMRSATDEYRGPAPDKGTILKAKNEIPSLLDGIRADVKPDSGVWHSPSPKAQP